MANNFKNAFATNVSMNSASPTDVYTSATGGSGVNSILIELDICLLYTSPSPRDRTRSRMPSSA